MQHARPNFLYYREPLELGLKGGSSTPVTTWPSSTVLKKSRASVLRDWRVERTASNSLKKQ